MNSIVENRLKRGAEEVCYHSAKKMRLINHAYDHIQPTRGTKRRDREELEEPVKKSRITPCIKSVKRKGETLIMNPTKRVKSSHRTWRRSIQGCRLIYDARYDNNKDGDDYMVVIAIVA